MHYQSLNAALEQYISSLPHHPASPDSLALHIDRQTQGCLFFSDLYHNLLQKQVFLFSL